MNQVTSNSKGAETYANANAASVNNSEKKNGQTNKQTSRQTDMPGKKSIL